MRFVSFKEAGTAEPRLGFIVGDRVVDLAAGIQATAGMEDGVACPADMTGFIEAAASLIPAARVLAALAGRDDLRDAVSRPLAETELLAPIPRPRKNVFCVGRNYAAHAAEGARAQGREVVVPSIPEFFTKPPTAVTGPESTVPLDPAVTEKFDYEVELGVVIGATGKNIPRERAMEHVFGFTIVNDFSARDLQRSHGQWFKGKALDRSCALGPWIVHKDDLPNFADLRITLRVNGETRQDSRTSNMVHDVPAIIESLSRGLTLEPGDIIATGTPEGVGYAMDPPRFLRSGDVVEAEIERIGVLRNRIG